ncbi:MAG: DegT/DnrJ/EryC1/StrS family aminotransferase [Anaerolineaceae bacterium]
MFSTVPLSSPDLTEAEREAVLAVLNTPNLSMGTQILAFEDSFRQLMNCSHAIGVNSGTAGLHLCIRAAGIQPGDLVLTTPFSFVSSTNVILFEGAVPVFVDVDPLTGNLDVVQLEQAAHDLTEGGDAARRWQPRQGSQEGGRLKAILAVDVFGQPADWDAIRAIADRYGLILIEDSCEALGAEYKQRKAGSFGDYGVFAFYPNKQITTAEGGMIVTNDARGGKLMQALRNQGRAPGDTWLQHTYLGYNYRLDELSAALGVAQMNRLEELLQKRQTVADWYFERLSEIQGIEVPYIAPETTRMSWFVYVLRLNQAISREKLASRLEEHGIPVRPYFLPIHLQPYLVEKFGFQAGDFPVTENLGERGLAIPFSGVMTEDQVDYVSQVIRKELPFALK